MANMGITAHRRNKNLKFDSKTLKFGDQEANALIHQPMRAPWQIQAWFDELAKAHPKHQGVQRRSGHLAILGHRSIVAFRNIRIAEMK